MESERALREQFRIKWTTAQESLQRELKGATGDGGDARAELGKRVEQLALELDAAQRDSERAQKSLRDHEDRIRVRQEGLTAQSTQCLLMGSSVAVQTEPETEGPPSVGAPSRGIALVPSTRKKSR